MHKHLIHSYFYAPLEGDKQFTLQTGQKKKVLTLVQFGYTFSLIPGQAYLFTLVDATRIQLVTSELLAAGGCCIVGRAYAYLHACVSCVCTLGETIAPTGTGFWYSSS